MKKVFLSASFGAFNELSLVGNALSEEGMEVLRADTLQPGADLTSEILSAIKRCDVFVAFLDRWHANVLFELGYALGSGKNILLIRKSVGELPFDIASFPVLVVDQFDARSISETVESIKNISIRPRAEMPVFKTPRDMIKRMVQDESFLDSVAPETFENCIMAFFRETAPPTAVVTPGDTKSAFDFAMRDVSSGSVKIFEVKKLNRNSRLAVSTVHRLLGAAVAAKASHAIMVTSGGYTSSARFSAQQSPFPVSLLTIDDLVELSAASFALLTERTRSN